MPICLILRVLDVVEFQRAITTVIAPKWPAQPWYRRLVKQSIARSHEITPKINNLSVHWRSSGTLLKCEMANLCLEDIWRSRLTQLGWSLRATVRFKLSWARGMLRSYNNLLLQLHDYCHELNDLHFQQMKSTGLANLYCVISSKSHCPQSILRTAYAAIGHLHKAKGLENILQDEALQQLITVLIKKVQNVI